MCPLISTIRSTYTTELETYDTNTKTTNDFYITLKNYFKVKTSFTFGKFSDLPARPNMLAALRSMRGVYYVSATTLRFMDLSTSSFPYDVVRRFRRVMFRFELDSVPHVRYKLIPDAFILFLADNGYYVSTIADGVGFTHLRVDNPYSSTNYVDELALSVYEPFLTLLSVRSSGTCCESEDPGIPQGTIETLADI